MPNLQVIQKDVTDALAREVFGPLDCEDYGIVVLKGVTSWSDAAEALPFRISHDEREAPFVIDDEGREQSDIKISFSDENDYIACAWARTKVGSRLLGVGIDLASTDDFGDKPAAQRFISLLFSDREHEIAREAYEADPSFAYAMLFGAKEAAFKATAQPLRTWYDTRDEELAFEVRHFSMVDPGIERGEQRNGSAQHAMDRMGVSLISIHHVPLDGMALVVATALSRLGEPEVSHDDQQ